MRRTASDKSVQAKRLWLSFFQTRIPHDPPKTAQGISGFSADVDEDYAWLSQNAFSKNPEVFPADKFGPEHFRWAVGVALSRSFFVNGELRLTPLVDFANHASIRGVLEPTGGWSCCLSCCRPAPGHASAVCDAVSSL